MPAFVRPGVGLAITLEPVGEVIDRGIARDSGASIRGSLGSEMFDIIDRNRRGLCLSALSIALVILAVTASAAGAQAPLP